jgi:hypothetical protein
LGRGLLDGGVCAACGGTGHLSMAEWLTASAEEMDEEADEPGGHAWLRIEPLDPKALEETARKVWMPLANVDEQGGPILGEVWINDPRLKVEGDDGAWSARLL